MNACFKFQLSSVYFRTASPGPHELCCWYMAVSTVLDVYLPQKKKKNVVVIGGTQKRKLITSSQQQKYGAGKTAGK